MNSENLSEGFADQNPIEITKESVLSSAREKPLHLKVEYLEEKEEIRSVEGKFPNDITKVDSDIEISDAMPEPSDGAVDDDCDVPSERENLGTSEMSREERPRV